MKKNIDIQGAKDAITAGIIEGVNKYADMVMPLIRNETPVDTGRLVNSERADDIDDGMGKRFSANTYYATFVHENVYFEHPRGGKAKFIIDPIITTQEQAEKIIGDAVKDKLNQ